ncbi:MAG: IS1 family transposase [Cyanobacteria bacterium J06632_3]
MNCPFCDRANPHKHGKTSKGSQRFRCSHCRKTFTETRNTLYYRRQVTPAQVETILQARAQGRSLRHIARTGDRAYGTVISVVRAADNGAASVSES